MSRFGANFFGFEPNCFRSEAVSPEVIVSADNVEAEAVLGKPEAVDTTP